MANKTTYNKKKLGKKKGTLTAAQKKKLDTQQISDKLVREVSGGKMSYRQAMKKQRKSDSTSMVNNTKVNKTVRTSSQGLPTKRKAVKARHKRDNKGNIKAY